MNIYLSKQKVWNLILTFHIMTTLRPPRKVSVSAKLDMVSPSPVSLHSPLHVRCCVTCVGGVAQFPGWTSTSRVSAVCVKVVSQDRQSDEMLASYSTVTGRLSSTVLSDTHKYNVSGGGGRSSAHTSGTDSGTDTSYVTRVTDTDTTHVTLVILSAQCQDIREYVCQFNYTLHGDVTAGVYTVHSDVTAGNYTQNGDVSKGEKTVEFRQNASVKADPPQGTLTVQPEHSQSQPYDIGQVVLFTCKVQGAESLGLRVHWQTANCAAPETYSDVEKMKKKDPRVTPLHYETRHLYGNVPCSVRLSAITARLSVVVGQDVCGVRCLASGHKGQVKVNFTRQPGDHFKSGTKTFATLSESSSSAAGENTENVESGIKSDRRQLHLSQDEEYAHARLEKPHTDPRARRIRITVVAVVLVTSGALLYFIFNFVKRKLEPIAEERIELDLPVTHRVARKQSTTHESRHSYLSFRGSEEKVKTEETGTVGLASEENIQWHSPTSSNNTSQSDSNEIPRLADKNTRLAKK